MVTARSFQHALTSSTGEGEEIILLVTHQTSIRHTTTRIIKLLSHMFDIFHHHISRYSELPFHKPEFFTRQGIMSQTGWSPGTEKVQSQAMGERDRNGDWGFGRGGGALYARRPGRE